MNLLPKVGVELSRRRFGPHLKGSCSPAGHNGRMEWTKVTSLPSQQEADLFAGRLGAAGIQTRVSKGSQGALAWLSALGNAVGPVDVYVPANEERSARQILGEVGSSAQGPAERSHQRTTLLVGRGLLAFALVAVVATVLISALR